MKKFLISALVLSSALAAPAFAFAQNNAPITRAQVKAELAQLEKAGYSPGGEDINYPQDLQAAEKRVWEQQGNAATSYGSSTSGMSASGNHVSIAPNDATQPTYFGQ
jgi:hypothetical protein